jgi:hypothetical protein
MRSSCNGSRYNIAEEDGEGTLITVDNWVEFIKPGMKISMSMILRKSSAPELALVATLNAGALNWPDVDFAGTYVTSIADSHERLTHVWSSSHLCQVTFRIYEEERIVELPEIPRFQIQAVPPVKSRTRLQRHLNRNRKHPLRRNRHPGKKISSSEFTSFGNLR